VKDALDFAGVVFMAVGTPSCKDGSADLKALMSVVDEIARAGWAGYKVFVIKSTVPVGTNSRVRDALLERMGEASFAVVSNPEFLKEGTAVADTLSPERVVIGVDQRHAAAVSVLKDLYAPFFRRTQRFLVMSPESAEIVKYAANTMLATRIALMNEVARLCSVTGANIDDVRVGVGADSRIGDQFLFPGPGFGGSCFPKDVRALAHSMRSNNVSAPIVAAITRSNEEQLQEIPRKVLAYLRSAALTGSPTVTVWGVSYKAGTDDDRESPAIPLVESLLSSGVSVVINDPEAMSKFKAGPLGGRCTYSDCMYGALVGSDALVVMTEWGVYRSPDFLRIKKALRAPVIFDARNLYNPALMRLEYGFEYYSIGRP
jgi:UDPglucose 6-dehydrogenase